ncbi:carboxyvinyl-carboxyphosphonate phosphorylmutase [Bordetella ansorpii]|uniref:2-methylisocitrate lyase n=1 Tax=Bordetella ansorpii TaxID=288768 RepID=A0A157Q8R3_9BORD|nr:oxaloacetate decarboxylase [Bordetella ansorpii]SAI42121.1 carboxyvinyl-carboxyphosphonate phosphorylmutase [Bordetella ansorpii]
MTLSREIPANAVPGVLRVKPARTRLLSALTQGDALNIVPGAYDCITARLVERAGFQAVYVTGSGISMSALGAPDVSLMSFSEVLDRVRQICDVVDIPVIADADTGYGGPLNVIRTVRELERAGVAGIQLEDQAWPKKCGHEPNRTVVPEREMIDRIKAAVDNRADADLHIVARTDARTTQGLAAAIDRANRYREAGADVIFVESPESEQELAQVAQSVDAPVLANMVEGGRTPILTGERLRELGYRYAIYPNALTRALSFAGARMLASLAEQGSTHAQRDAMLDHRALWNLFDYPQWTALEDRYSGKDGEA